MCERAPVERLSSRDATNREHGHGEGGQRHADQRVHRATPGGSPRWHVFSLRPRTRDIKILEFWKI
jgi:hypothetical protein